MEVCHSHYYLLFCSILNVTNSHISQVFHNYFTIITCSLRMSQYKDCEMYQRQFHLNSKFENIFAILQWPKDDLLRFGRVWKILSFGFFCSFQRFEDFKVRALLRGFLKISELDFVWVFELPEVEAWCLFMGLMLVWLRPAGSFSIITRILKTRILKGFGLSQGLLAVSNIIHSCKSGVSVEFFVRKNASTCFLVASSHRTADRAVGPTLEDLHKGSSILLSGRLQILHVWIRRDDGSVICHTSSSHQVDSMAVDIWVLPLLCYC